MENTNNFSLTTQENTEILAPAPVYMDDDTNYIVDLTERTTSYCSMVAETQEQKAVLYNAMNAPEKRLKECVNLEINIKDVFVEVVNCTNKNTGLIEKCPRTVIIDDKGIGYQAVSLGVFSALKKLFAVYGEPISWEKPLRVRVKQISKSADKNILTLEVVTK